MSVEVQKLEYICSPTKGLLSSKIDQKSSASLGCEWHIIKGCIAGTIRGQKCLDFGCGPTIHYPIIPSRWFDEIYFADFPKNLTEITKWIDRSPGAFDWTYFFEEYAILEG